MTQQSEGQAVLESGTETAMAANTEVMDIFKKTYTHTHQPVGAEYLSFGLGAEYYGVDILCVKEIRAWEHVTRIPNTPEYIKGVINLRGSIVPVVDLRQYFGFDDIEYHPKTVVIVMAIGDSETQRQISIVVDAVSDVIRIADEDIKKAPQVGDDRKAGFVSGLVTAEINKSDLSQMDAGSGAQNRETTRQVSEAGKTEAHGEMVMLLDLAAIDRLIDSTDEIYDQA